ncbi:MAG TPA: C39 family peptidase [Deltaproteobacteria bacterium]|nr:C39 family peptidase [Deltaproteobacteria bacterium]
MEVVASFLIIIAFLTTIHPLQEIPDNELIVYTGVPGMELAQKYQVKTFTQFKDENIVKQEYDYSCGSAALATLLNYHLGENLNEQQVIQGLMRYGDTQLIEQRRAFSLLDMKRFVGVLGYNGNGYKADLNDLTGLESPCIIPIEFWGYKHFVVYRGTYGDHIFFADPYMGNLSFTISEFETMWYQNILFLITPDGGVTLDALQLREEDLRLVDIRTVRDIVPTDIPAKIIADEHKFKESYGKYQFKNVNVR